VTLRHRVRDASRKPRGPSRYEGQLIRSVAKIRILGVFCMANGRTLGAR
jgi:hypothetical protein